MGCCCSEPVSERTETRTVVRNTNNRPSTTCNYSDILQQYEKQVQEASRQAYVEDASMY